MISTKRIFLLFFCTSILLIAQNKPALAQCGGIMEPGFAFLILPTPIRESIGPGY